MRRGDSAHGGQRRAVGAKKFLKTFKKRMKTRKLGAREVLEGGAGPPYIERTLYRARGAIFRSRS